MKLKYKIAITAGSGLAGGLIGYLFGIDLHDLIAYSIPIAMFEKHSWFNPEQYTNLYNYYSHGLRELFGKVFSLVGGSLGAYFGYSISSLFDYKKKP